MPGTLAWRAECLPERAADTAPTLSKVRWLAEARCRRESLDRFDRDDG